MITETLAIIFLVYRRYTPNPRRITSYPGDNTFGSTGVVIQYPTVNEVTDPVEKLN